MYICTLYITYVRTSHLQCGLQYDVIVCAGCQGDLLVLDTCEYSLCVYDRQLAGVLSVAMAMLPAPSAY